MTTPALISHRAGRLRRLLAAAAIAPCFLAAAAPSARADLQLPGFPVASPAVDGLGDLDIAVSPDGSAHYAYQRQSVGLVAATRSPDGTVGAERPLAVGNYPQVAASGSGATQYAWVGKDGANWVVRTRRIEADGTVGPVTDLSSAGFDAWEPAIASSADGSVTFLWWRYLPSGDAIVQARRRLADGSFGPVQSVSLAMDAIYEPRLATDAAGNAYIAWTGSNGNGWDAFGRRWHANGTLGPLHELSALDKGNVSDARVAVDPAGNAHFGWIAGNIVVQTRRLAANAVLDPIRDLTAGDQDVRELRATQDPTGGARFVWRGGSGANTLVVTRRTDADGTPGSSQLLGHFSTQSNMEQADPSVAVDEAGRATVLWRTAIPFDGRMRAVARTVLADGTLGPLQDVHTPTDSAETVTHRPRVAAGMTGPAIAGWIVLGPSNVVMSAVGEPVPVKPNPECTDPSCVDKPDNPEPPRTGTGTGTPPAADTTAPALANLRLRLRRVRSGRPLLLSVGLSEAATLRFSVLRRGAGRKVAGGCRAKTQANRRRPACSLELRGSLTASGRSGANALRLATRLDRRALAPGSYELVARATDAAGNVSAPVKVRFTVRRKRSR